MVKSIQSREEYEEILSSQKKVVILWTAPWCSHCKAIAPKLDQYEKEYVDLTFIKADIDDLPDVAQDADITGMPTFKFIDEGQLKAHLTGANDAQLLQGIKNLAAITH
ncbi:hypothetical protein EDD21DRAFT_446815 [Dissophora ornata]|nr:Cytoplasmic thioredoxin isoenzyme 2 [Dissophora ornata]KAI8597691.1 hypothetical protein EDD21DRAFT_446815 [Dissophora ornata]